MQTVTSAQVSIKCSPTNWWLLCVQFKTNYLSNLYKCKCIRWVEKQFCPHQDNAIDFLVFHVSFLTYFPPLPAGLTTPSALHKDRRRRLLGLMYDLDTRWSKLVVDWNREGTGALARLVLDRKITISCCSISFSSSGFTTSGFLISSFTISVIPRSTLPLSFTDVLPLAPATGDWQGEE